MSDSFDTLPIITADQVIRRSWTVALMLGILSIVLGIMVMVWPSQTLMVIAVVIGLQLVVSGVYRLVRAMGGESGTPWLVGIAGVLLLLGGIVAIRNPAGTVAVLTLILGVAWVASGLVEFVAALSSVYRHRIWMFLGAALSFVAGLVVLTQPGLSITALAWITGLYALVSGAVLVIEAFALRP